MSGRTALQGRRLLARGLAALGACAAAAALAAPAAQAEFSLTEFGASTTEHGTFSRQAGAHPDLTTKVRVGGLESLRDVGVSIPPGLVGNPTATDRCSTLELVAAEGRNAACPPTSQVGVVNIYSGRTYPNEQTTPLWNMVPPPTLPALFALNVDGVVVFLEPSVRPSDYSIFTRVTDTTMAKNIAGSAVTFWGVPFDSSHDEQRFGAIGSAAKKPLITSPTSCTGTPTPFTAEVNSWQTPTFLHGEVSSDEEGTPFLWQGCDHLPFSPSLRVDPGARAAASPSGLAATLTIPQSLDPGRLATAHLRRAVVTLPQGYALSTAAASGIGACSEAQIGLGSNAAPTCPGSSSLGTVKVKTPLLDDELDGEIFVAKQNENPFGSLIAVYVAIKGPGFYIKLPGKVDADPVTGQLTTTFDELPQLPFETMKLQFRGGAKAPLVAPDKCGEYDTHAELTSWASSTPVQLDSPVTINEKCDTGGFDPVLHAGSTNPIAGANTPFNVQIVRQDGEQNLSRVETTLPPGLVARLAGIPLCQGADAAAGNCPAASQIGATTVGGGNGPQPLYLPEPGKAPTHVYFGGPYKGAPYSMVFVVPAQAGPFDLGNVVVRAAITIDPTTTQVTVKSDPLPQILQGIPLDYRDLRIEITKPSFTLNPTNCEPMRFQSTITSDLGAVATPSARFQVSDCGALGFKPKLALRLKGGTHRGDFPALTATLTARQGDANIGKAAVTLPHSEFLEQAHIRTICTRVQFAQKACPAASIYGKATATSPLIDGALEGPVYLRSSSHPLPDLVADLDGAFEVVLVGRIDSVHQGIRNSFEVIPDAPVTKFTLSMMGGKQGLLVNSRNLCKGVNRAQVRLVGQNGKRSNSGPVVTNSCGKGAKGKRSKRAVRR